MVSEYSEAMFSYLVFPSQKRNIAYILLKYIKNYLQVMEMLTKSGDAQRERKGAATKRSHNTPRIICNLCFHNHVLNFEFLLNIAYNHVEIFCISRLL